MKQHNKIIFVLSLIKAEREMMNPAKKNKNKKKVPVNPIFCAVVQTMSLSKVVNEGLDMVNRARDYSVIELIDDENHFLSASTIHGTSSNFEKRKFSLRVN